MVRLKVTNKDWYLYNARFQFQYGAIKRNKEMKKEYDDLIFQFQYGAIKSILAAGSRSSKTISIPVWCD